MQTMEYVDAQEAVAQGDEYEYKPSGEISRWEQVRATGGAREWELHYDAISQLTEGTRKELTSGTVLETVRYDYDAGWNRTRSLKNQNVNAFTYATGNELISEVSRGLTTISGTTDLASRVTVNAEPATEGAFATTFVAGLDLPEGTHEIKVVALAENTLAMTTQKWEVESVNTAGRTLSYDTLGNLVNDGERTYEWDAENRLVGIEYAGSGNRTEMEYDGLSRRVRMVEKENGTVVSDRRFLWDGLEIAEERDANGVVVKRYFGQGEQWPGESAPADKRYYLRDHLGSVTGVVNASGTMVVEYGYGLWGDRTVLSGTGSSDRGFTGHFTHARSGLVLAPYRAYDPETARWLSRDPIEEAGGINLYGYVANNPINWTDSTGLAIDVFVDLGFMAYDIYNIFTDPANRGDHFASLGLNAVGAALPFATGLGAGYKAGKAVSQQACVAARVTPHKNSLDYVGETHVYRVKGPDGTYKIGESAQGVRVGDGASIRAEQQVRRLQRETGEEFRSDIRRTFPDKASARDYETRLIERFRRMYGEDTLPGNKTNR